MSGRFIAGVFIVVVSVVAVALVWVGVRDYESFTPPVATAVDRADCLAPDIAAALVSPEARDSSTALRPEGSGYPPPDFSPVAVVRCERGEASDGGLTIDAVRLEGDIDAVDDAFREQSRRFPANVQASCAYRHLLPAGLWLLDDAGAAIRPTWPTEPCGLQEQPYVALSQLHEASREQHLVAGISSDDAGTCAESIGLLFETTTETDVDRMAAHDDTYIRPLTETPLTTPISDVGRLQVCRYSTEPPLPESRSRLSRQQSTDLMEVASTAPPAGPCDLVAQHIALIDVLRPDGSGGTRMAVELDGCQRVNLLGQRQLPAGVIALLLQ
ncbi:hypothetical protein O4214_02295 [Rhodococcus erythropolis]|uniref:hypothetical protein n=1 Tax=Rhodococcus erythropolis TaxID=1833 RepID=UPI001E318C2D|nr:MULTISPECIES: hypothetical protein [Rhodococcus erythropolis group]MCD2103749.1 hypothetical protein [Rhodococcus qingshengii]MCZ4522799.1 hypothetical protein [Rhodococcus erythropolis]